jgi:hypothetical protein
MLKLIKGNALASVWYVISCYARLQLNTDNKLQYSDHKSSFPGVSTLYPEPGIHKFQLPIYAQIFSSIQVSN